MLLSRMPHRTWSAIKGQGQFLGLKRMYRRENLGIDENTSWADYQFCQELQIPPNSRETICIVEDEGTNLDLSSLLPFYHRDACGRASRAQCHHSSAPGMLLAGRSGTVYMVARKRSRS
jgi:hypothetical protein